MNYESLSWFIISPEGSYTMRGLFLELYPNYDENNHYQFDNNYDDFIEMLLNKCREREEFMLLNPLPLFPPQ